MDKELAQLEEWAVNLINDYESVLKASKAKGEKVSQTEFKRIGRFSGELVANPEAYGELLEMARSKNLTGKQLVQSIRSIEANLLDESSRNTATSRKQMLSDVIHHLFAQRTGGDTLRKLSQAERGEARTILRDSFGRWGNVPENLVSLFRGWHLSGDELKGLEGEALQEFGITKAGQLSTTKAHATAPVSKLISGTHDVSTGREAAQLMTPQFELQRKEGLAAIEESKPLMEALNEIAGSEYNRATMSAEELAVRRNVLSANPEQVKAAIQQYTAPFRFNGGGATLNRAALTGLAAAGVAALGPLGTAASAAELAGRTQIAGETNDPADQFQAGLAGVSLGADVASYVPPLAPIGEAVSTVADVANIGIDVYREDPKKAKQMVTQQAKRMIPADPIVTPVQRAAQAVQRGGRVKFGFGGAKFTLPELGLSELLRFN
jgi:hypothetical protein